MFLLVRDLTDEPLAAFVAGLAFAFAPYRFDQLSHLQVLSAQWMPFVLYGFRRYLETGRRRALAGGAAALVAQNLSCGYYTLFFTPFAGAYVIYELAVRRRLGDWAAWRAFGAAGLVVAMLTLPFLKPYLDVRSSGVGVRSPGRDLHVLGRRSRVCNGAREAVVLGRTPRDFPSSGRSGVSRLRRPCVGIRGHRWRIPAEDKTGVASIDAVAPIRRRTVDSPAGGFPVRLCQRALDRPLRGVERGHLDGVGARGSSD